MAADVPLGGRSYVQTRFLATEDSSTLTIALRVSSYKKHTLPKNLRRTSGPFLVFDSGSSIRISRVVEVLALAFNYGLAKPIADVY